MRFAHRTEARGDEGASLLLVLVFVLIVGSALAALLPYTQTGIMEVNTARQVRSVQNAVDGAMQGAIDQARINTDACVGTDRPTYTAPAYPDPVQPTNPAAATNVTVTCAPGTGGSNSNANVPPYAILTTNGPLTVGGNNVLTVDGGIYTNGNITKGSGSGNQLLVNVVGPVYTTAGHTCDSGLVYASAFPPNGTPHCPAQSGDPSIPDTSAAEYPSSLGTSVPATKDPLGTCTSANSIVTFVPGYYSEIPQVDPVSCKNNNSDVWWFAPCTAAATGGSCSSGTAPGTYYLDFPDGNYDNYASTQATWDLNSSKLNLIGGSLKNGWGPSTTYNTVDGTAAGTRCDSSGIGVQLVLGGPTQLQTGTSASIELCASATDPGGSEDGAQQRIALYGIPSDYPSATAGPRSDTTNGPTAPTTTASVSGDTDFSSPSGAKQHADSNVARGDYTGTATKYGVTLSNYTTPADGNLVTHAWLEVTHAETDTSLDPNITVKYPVPGGTITDTCQLNGTGSSTLQTDEIDLMNMKSSNCTQSGPATNLGSASLRWFLMKNMTVTYEVSGSKNVGSTSNPAHAYLDGVELKTKTIPPSIEPERIAKGEANSSFYAFTNSDNFNPADNNAYFIGTVYTPNAPVWAAVHNTPFTIFRRGVVVQGLTANANSSSKQGDAPFELPSSFTSRSVLFTASIGSTVELRALVKFVDYTPPDAGGPSDSAQYFPGRAVVIKEWTNLDQ
ncbi:MAG: hypothetical protein ACTHK4_14335 [Mycobacteriales bacterium]